MAYNSLLTDFSSKGRLDREDPRWSQLFSTFIDILSFTGEESFFQHFVDRLRVNNPITGNLNTLLEHCVFRLRQLFEKKNRPSVTNLNQCAAAVHLLCLFVKSFTSTMSIRELKSQLFLHIQWPLNIFENHIDQSSIHTNREQEECTPTNKSTKNIKYHDELSGDETLCQLIDEIMRILTLDPLPNWMYEVAHCTSNLLLALCSTQLYLIAGEHTNDNRLEEDPCLLYIYIVSEIDTSNRSSHGDRDISACKTSKLIKALLSHALSGKKLEANINPILLRSRGKRIQNEGGWTKNYFYILMQQIFAIGGGDVDNNHTNSNGDNGMITTGGKEAGVGENQSQSAKVRIQNVFLSNPFAERCRNILTILLFNRKAINDTNSFREIFGSLYNLSTENDMESIELEDGMKSTMPIDLDSISKNLAHALDSESGILLLYAFLTMHPTYLDYLISSGNVIDMLAGILHQLYKCSDSACVDSLYILIICVLIIIKNPLCRQQLSETTIHAAWYTEHKLNEITVTDLIILCLLRTTMFSLFRLRDEYLLSNCFAVLLDLAMHVNNINCYVSERIAKIIFQLIKRWSKQSDDKLAPSISNSVKQTIYVLLKVSIVVLRSQTRLSNVHLLYALMLQKDKIEEVSNSIVDELESIHANDQVMSACDFLMKPREFFGYISQHYSLLFPHTTGCDEIKSYSSADEAVANLKEQLEKEDDSAQCMNQDNNIFDFTYGEGDDSAAFFVPFAWTAVVRSDIDMCWFLVKVNLIDPAEKNLL
jgi:hypothetical protein